MKYARNSFKDPYPCKQKWPDDCFVQCGDMGLVLNKGSLAETLDADNPIKSLHDNTSYTTAFFEAFPKDPSTFIRGEGKDIEEAELKAFNKFERISNCKGHKFERRGYKNGAGICKHCNMFKSKVFEPTTKCCICDKPTYYSSSKDNKKWYCEEHNHLKPDSEKNNWQIEMERTNNV